MKIIIICSCDNTVFCHREIIQINTFVLNIKKKKKNDSTLYIRTNI